MKNLSRQKGSVDMIGSLICLSLLSLLFLYTLKRVQQWKNMKKNLDQIICVKKHHIQTSQIIKFVHRINQILVANNIIQLASLFFPHTWTAQPSIRRIKKMLKLSQRVKLAHYYQQTLSLFKSRCRLNPLSLKSPFKLKGLNFHRDAQGLTKLRKNKWRHCHPLSFQILCSKYELNSSLKTQLKIETTMNYLPLNF